MCNTTNRSKLWCLCMPEISVCVSRSHTLEEANMYTWRVITWHIDLHRRGNSKHESRRRQPWIKDCMQFLHAVRLCAFRRDWANGRKQQRQPSLVHSRVCFVRHGTGLIRATLTSAAVGNQPELAKGKVHRATLACLADVHRCASSCLSGKLYLRQTPRPRVAAS